VIEMAGKDDDFLSENFSPPSDAGSGDDIVAVFPGIAGNSGALESRERGLIVRIASPQRIIVRCAAAQFRWSSMIFFEPKPAPPSA
jgi:hypothetical protein